MVEGRKVKFKFENTKCIQESNPNKEGVKEQIIRVNNMLLKAWMKNGGYIKFKFLNYLGDSFADEISHSPSTSGGYDCVFNAAIAASKVEQ